MPAPEEKQQPISPELEKFLTDPKHATEKAFLWAAFDAYVAEREQAAASKKSTNENFLKNIFPFVS